jgi:hypothetical protein
MAMTEYNYTTFSSTRLVWNIGALTFVFHIYDNVFDQIAQRILFGIRVSIPLLIISCTNEAFTRWLSIIATGLSILVS